MDYDAAVLFVQKVPLDRIAEKIGVATPAAAWKAAQRGLRDNPPENLDEQRAAVAIELGALKQELWESAHTTNYVYASGTGQLVYGPDGLPLIDREQNDRARERLLKVLDRQCRMFGLDAAKQTHLTIDSVEVEIRRLESELTIRTANTPAAAPATEPPAIDPPSVVSAEPVHGSLEPPHYERPVPPAPVTDSGKRKPEPMAEDYADAYRQPPPQPTPDGWHRSERRTSWD